MKQLIAILAFLQFVSLFSEFHDICDHKFFFEVVQQDVCHDNRSSSLGSCPSDNFDNLRCDQCGKTFMYNPECIAKLGQHSCKDHWLNKIVHFVQGTAKIEHPMEVQWIANARVNVKRLKHNKFLDLYKTTIETWQDGPTELRCCSCGYAGAPYIRKQKNKIASTRLGHYLLMACWPICFAPLAVRSEISLYCKKCGAFFGCYDADTGCLIQSHCSSHVNCRVSSCSKCY